MSRTSSPRMSSSTTSPSPSMSIRPMVAMRTSIPVFECITEHTQFLRGLAGATHRRSCSSAISHSQTGLGLPSVAPVRSRHTTILLTSLSPESTSCGVELQLGRSVPEYALQEHQRLAARWHYSELCMRECCERVWSSRCVISRSDSQTRTNQRSAACNTTGA